MAQTDGLGTPTTEGGASVTGGFHSEEAPVRIPPERANALSAQPSNLYEVKAEPYVK